jgi:threonylcarbamoyladenosine tRNA methylthiotransferase MtaB
MLKVFVRNFGCRATQADGAALETEIARHGHQPVPDSREADIVVLNTCTVTAAADDDVRQAVRRLHRENPETRILVTGCYAQRAPRELAALPGVHWVIGNSHKAEIPALLGERAPVEFHGLVRVGEIGDRAALLAAPVDAAAGDRTRPNLKIQDGCNNVCSFCVIPSVRGRSRSADPETVIAEVRRLAGLYREVVLSGINLGRWGRDAGNPPSYRLAGLIARILDETGVELLRLSSIEPMDWSDELLDLVASSPRIAPHVHAPLQSGCDAVLKRMKRRYRTRHYAGRILRARGAMSDAAIGADVMVGFPGETDAEFEESRAFIDSMPFTYLHVFTYSERPGTPAAASPGVVPIAVRKQRNAVLRELASRKNLAFRQRFVGRSLRAVVLDGGVEALSDNYLPIRLTQSRASNRIEWIPVGSIDERGLAEASLLPVLATS